MKKVKISGKLSLNKERIAKLNDESMSYVRGGRPEPMDPPAPIYSKKCPSKKCYSHGRCPVL